IVAASLSITLHDGDGTHSLTAVIEAARRAAVSLLEWPGVFSLRVQRGELTRGGRTFALELNSEKTTSGLALALVLIDGGAPVLRLTTQSARTADGVVTTHVDVDGDMR